MKTKTLALIHTVRWFDEFINKPFVYPWLRSAEHVRIVNIMDDSLLTESLVHRAATPSVLKRIQYYVMAAEAQGADVIMCTCTTVGEATRIARGYVSVPVFNIDEPMARQAVRLGRRLGIVATLPTSPAATKRQLEYAAQQAGISICIDVVVNTRAFDLLQQGKIDQHNQLIHREMDRLAKNVDVLVLGQVSLGQIKHKVDVPVLQVGHSGFDEARRLLGLDVPKAKERSLARVRPVRTAATQRAAAIA